MPKTRDHRQLIRRRAWSVLRLALLWTRKGGLFKRRLMMELRVVPKFLKSLGNPTPRGHISYTREKELSFDKTPVFHVKMYRPTSMRFSIPCMNPPEVDMDYESDDEDEETRRGCEYERDFGGRVSFLMSQEDGCCCSEEDERRVQEDDREEGIDLRAEEFIAKFYEQMKLQRQISYLQYNERLSNSY